MTEVKFLRQVLQFQKQDLPGILLFQAEKDAFVSVRAIQKFAKKLQRKGRTSCEYMYMPGSKHEIFGSDDETMQAYVERILSFLE